MGIPRSRSSAPRLHLRREVYGQLAKRNEDSSLSASGQQLAVIITGGPASPQPRSCSCFRGAPVHTTLWTARRVGRRACRNARGRAGCARRGPKTWANRHPGEQCRRAPHNGDVGCSCAWMLRALLRERRTAPSRTQREGRASTGHPRSHPPPPITMRGLRRQSRGARRGGYGRGLAWQCSRLCTAWVARRERTAVLRLPGGVTREHSRAARMLMMRVPDGTRCRYGTIRLQLESASSEPWRCRRTNPHARGVTACPTSSHVAYQVATAANPAPSSAASSLHAITCSSVMQGDQQTHELRDGASGLLDYST